MWLGRMNAMDSSARSDHDQPSLCLLRWMMVFAMIITTSRCLSPCIKMFVTMDGGVCHDHHHAEHQASRCLSPWMTVFVMIIIMLNTMHHVCHHESWCFSCCSLQIMVPVMMIVMNHGVCHAACHDDRRGSWCLAC